MESDDTYRTTDADEVVHEVESLDNLEAIGPTCVDLHSDRQAKDHKSASLPIAQRSFPSSCLVPETQNRAANIMLWKRSASSS